MNIISFPVSSLNLQLRSFQALVNLSDNLTRANAKIDVFDMSNLSWFDACLCSPLAAILHPHISKSTIIEFGSRESLAGILQRNNFTQALFNDTGTRGQAATAVSFDQFNATDEDDFLEYVVEFCTPGKREFPKMTPVLLKKFREAILEIFNNSIEHSETVDGIFACGQLYPQKHQLKFAVTDRGIGVVERIRRSLDKVRHIRFSA